MKTEFIKFENRDGIKLTARLEKPVNSQPGAYVLFAHCFTCSKNIKAAGNISRALTSQGYAVLRFDFTGIGESEGEFEDTDFSSNVEDLVDAAAFLRENYEAPSLLAGHSLGGSACLIAGKLIEEVKGVVTIGAPYKPEHVKKLLTEDVKKIEEEGKAKVNIGGRPFNITKKFLKDIEDVHSKKEISELKKPLLILHSPNDLVVPVENAAEIYQAAFHPKSFISLDKADHLMSEKEDSLYAGGLISSWAVKYIKPEFEPQTGEIKQVVTRTSGDEFTTDITAGKHNLTGDEPEKYGGNDLGPTPYDLLLAALGSCTGMTIKKYAEDKGYDVKEIKVNLQHRKTHSEDCSSCDKDETAKIDEIERIIDITGDISDDVREKLIEIAKKCPVNKTLHSDIKVKTRHKK